LVTWTVPAVIAWCLRAYALLGLSLPLPRGVRLVYLDHTECVF
jgi:hypothetical protein